MQSRWWIGRGVAPAILAAALMFVGPAGSSGAEDAKANVVLRSGKIYTGDAQRSIKEACGPGCTGTEAG